MQLLFLAAAMWEASGLAARVHWSKLFEYHRVPAWHPENKDRATAALQGILKMVPGSEVVPTERLHPDVGTVLARVHDADYLLDLAQEVGLTEQRRLDEDTFSSRASWNVTRLATSAWLAAVDAALSPQEEDDLLTNPSAPARKKGRGGRRGGGRVVHFAATRPPGHHAKRSMAMGFCTLNHAAAAAEHALDKVDRVGLLDIDVHLGNGVASILGDDATKYLGRVRYCSMHQHPAFPFSGDDASKFGPEDLLKFLPLPPGTDADTWLRTLQDHALPWLADLDPQLLIISAGFDALATDDLAQLTLDPADYYEAARLVTAALPHVPVVAGLEGGYDLEAMPVAAAHLLNGFDHAGPLSCSSS